MAKYNYRDTLLSLLRAQRRPLTTSKIAKKTDITWPTAIKYLVELKSEGFVHFIIKGNKKYWHLVKTRDGREIKRVNLETLKPAKKPGKNIGEVKLIAYKVDKEKK